KGQVGGDVFGGYVLKSISDNTYAGDATDNEVHIKNQGKVNGAVYGGRTLYGEATGNKVTRSNDVEVGDGIAGGFVEDNGDANNNTVTLPGGSTGAVYGGFTQTGNATGNEITLSGDAEVGNSIAGGHVEDTGDANNNTVTMTTGSTALVSGGVTANGDATGNKVILSDAVDVDNVTGGIVETGNATNNNVELLGGSAGAVAGGEVFDGDAI